MTKGYTQVFCGDGDGKSSAAIGKAFIGAASGKKVIIIQFLKKKNNNEEEFFKILEPYIKLFRFEKTEKGFDTLSDEEKADEIMNIRNGICFAKKVLSTGECDILVLDEILGLVDEGIVSEEEINAIITAKSEDGVVLLTGINLPDKIKDNIDYASKIVSETL